MHITHSTFQLHHCRAKLPCVLVSILLALSPDRSRAADRAADYEEAVEMAKASGHDVNNVNISDKHL